MAMNPGRAPGGFRTFPVLLMLKSIPVIPHDRKAKVVGDAVLVAAVLAGTLHTSYRLTFGTFEFDGWYWLFTAVYLLDIGWAFNQSVKRGLLIYSTRSEIARHYRRGWFALDLLAALPLSWLFHLFVGPAPVGLAAAAAASLSVSRMLKVLKLSHFLADIRETLSVSPGLMRLLSFACWFFVALNLMSSGWCLIGATEAHRPASDQYLRALYWCLTTIATIGYGDYYPNHDSNLQIIYTMIVQVFGVGMYGYIIGNVSSLIAHLDVARANYAKKMEEIGDYMRARRLPVELQGRVRDYYAYLWETRKSVSSLSLTGELPHSLAMEIQLYLNRGILEKVALFRDADEIFVREIVHLLHPVVFLPGDFVIRQGEYGDCMYFLCEGDVEVLVNEQRVAVLGQGSPFGETALIQGERRTASIKALTYCDAYRLAKQDFDALRTKYPEFDAQVRRVVEERLRDTEAKTRGQDDHPA
ncbi:MAG: cyclic nucleotide-binding domain-containing protein [Candidatus Latescibacterota bacterium]|jgi:voltage-gated potassium channel